MTNDIKISLEDAKNILSTAGNGEIKQAVKDAATATGEALLGIGETVENGAWVDPINSNIGHTKTDTTDKNNQLSRTVSAGRGGLSASVQKNVGLGEGSEAGEIYYGGELNLSLSGDVEATLGTLKTRINGDNTTTHAGYIGASSNEGVKAGYVGSTTTTTDNTVTTHSGLIEFSEKAPTAAYNFSKSIDRKDSENQWLPKQIEATAGVGPFSDSGTDLHDDGSDICGAVLGKATWGKGLTDKFMGAGVHNCSDTNDPTAGIEIGVSRDLNTLLPASKGEEISKNLVVNFAKAVAGLVKVEAGVECDSDNGCKGFNRVEFGVDLNF